MSELFYISAARLAGMLRRREVSATEVVESCIERQIAVNDKLNAVVSARHRRISPGRCTACR
jgi:amidase